MRIQESLNNLLPLRDMEKSTNFAHDSNKSVDLYAGLGCLIH